MTDKAAEGVDNTIQLLVEFARLEGKIDASIMGHSTRLDNVERIQHDQEGRLRELQARATVQPKHVYAAATLFLAAIVAAAAVLGVIIR